jgi:hypothetical protein
MLGHVIHSLAAADRDFLREHGSREKRAVVTVETEMEALVTAVEAMSKRQHPLTFPMA